MKRHMGTHSRKRGPNRETLTLDNGLVLMKVEEQDNSQRLKEENIIKDNEVASQLQFDTGDHLETTRDNTLYVMPVLIT